MDQEVHVKFLQVLLKAYQLGEEYQEMTAEQMFREITPQLKAILTDLEQG